MFSCNDLKSGMTIIFNGTLHQVVETQFFKPGKGHAFIRTRLKNFKTNAIFEYSFRGKEDVEQAIVDKKDLQYLYRDKSMYYFMEPQSYEQIPVSEEKVSHLLDYLKEGETVHFTFFGNEVVEANLSEFIVLKVTEALPGVKGDTVQGGTKPVTLETGKVIQVPLFINQGESVKIDTRTGRYIERAKA